MSKDLIELEEAPVMNLDLTGEKNGYGGLMTYGGFDVENCEEPVTYEPVVSPSFWHVRLLEVSAGSYSSNGRWKAEPDTATSFIRGPAAIISAIAEEIGAQNKKR
ncbi:hypothetical protein Y032_0296g1693 [Ancylostoma ceylanicum]|uniref:Peptidase A1 domain-containing protein n=1 Tax=Ancylostoma ceylanicum TaxID=53326 RepID=A0A016S5G2_9BILA|nr:hypothetical protein Y032_0296g1693 [Ancylostoma ceylanicum]